jgi:flagellar motor component MotA
MAEAPGAKTQKPAGPAAGKGSKPKKGGLKPDLATLGGIGLALAGIIGGLLMENGSILDIAQATAAMIVLGGTFGAVLVTTPLPVFLQGLKALREVLFEQASSAGEMIETLIRFATQARKNGIVSLESEAGSIADPFLRIKEVGHGIAVAFVATVYGVAAANIFFLPSANKLRARIQRSRLLKELTLEGVIGIVEGLNPTLIRVKLSAFNQEPAVAPKPAKAEAKAKAKAKPPARAGAPQAAPAGD